MNTYFIKSTTIWALFASALLCLSGCSKNIINIDLGRESEEGSSTGTESSGNEESSLVSFHATVESRNMTRSMSPMQKGVASLVFAFKSPVASLEDPMEEGLYETTSVGVMTGVRDYKMHLPNGVYTFYAVSNNSYTTPPQFTDGVSHPLTNGIDYLWANNKLQDVASLQVNIPVIYLHSATQVVFEISSTPNLKLNKLLSATITPSKPGATMLLVNGHITPATDYAPAPVNMGINGFRTQYIMLPLKTTVPMQLVLNIQANGESTPRTYMVNVPVPQGELAAGNAYLFSAVLDENSVSFSDVNIINWTDVDETGNPLYPSPKQ